MSTGEEELLSRTFYVPAFRVDLKVPADPVPATKDITEVTYTDSTDGPSQISFTVMNFDPQARKLKYLDDSTFAPGKDVELWIGYHNEGELRRVLKGRLTTLEVDFPESGGPTLKVMALSRLALLQQEQRRKVWKKEGGQITDSEIATQIAGLNGLDIVAERTETGHKALLQDNQFDLVFLLERARWNNYELTYDSGDDKLYFRPSQAVVRKEYTLTWERSLLRFKPRLTTKDQVKQVKVRWWDTSEDKPKEVTVTRDELEGGGMGPSAMKGDVKRSLSGATEVLIDHPVETEAEARKLARAKLQGVVDEMQTCDGETIGLPDLRAGSVVEIKGVGETFGGKYFVTSTTHTLSDRGYRTSFQGKRKTS
jgi:phage protein D